MFSTRNPRRNMQIPRRSRTVMHFINRAFAEHKRGLIIRWFAKASDDFLIEPLTATDISGSVFTFRPIDFDEDHLLWCKQYVERQQQKKDGQHQQQTQTNKEQQKKISKAINILIQKYSRRKKKEVEFSQLVVRVLTNIKNGEVFNKNTYCDEYFLQKVCRLIIKEDPSIEIGFLRKHVLE